MSGRNNGSRFDRLPATADARAIEGRATRQEVLDFWDERYGIAPDTFAAYSLWEKGAGKVWAFRGEVESPMTIEALGMMFLRTRQEHWKPTTDAVQRFGTHAKENVIELDDDEARRFVAGTDQHVAWDGDWGYLVAAHDIAGEREPLGVGLFIDGELRSQVPKGRRREVSESSR
jgi:NOL1/NOP2/fmu family ribosome biogenesis protein